MSNTDLAAQTLNRYRRGRTPAADFNPGPWYSALEASDLHPADKQTARHLAARVNMAGQSYITAKNLAAAADVTREATISARLARLRDAGFITSTPRFKQPTCHQLTMPPARELTATLHHIGRALDLAA